MVFLLAVSLKVEIDNISAAAQETRLVHAISLASVINSAAASHGSKSAPSVNVTSEHQRRPPTAGVCARAPERRPEA